MSFHLPKILCRFYHRIWQPPAMNPKEFAKRKAERRNLKLFSKYNEGIRLSDAMTYSVTKELIAQKIAQLVKERGYKYVVDGCGGAGGNSIAFSLAEIEVAYVELNPKNIYDAEHNSLIYEADENIYFIEDNILDFDCSNLPGFHPSHTLFFCSPEWGGPGYLDVDKYDVSRLNPSLDALLNYAKAHKYPETVIFVPRNVDLEQVKQMGCVSCEYMFLEGWCDSICLWFDTGK